MTLPGIGGATPTPTPLTVFANRAAAGHAAAVPEATRPPAPKVDPPPDPALSQGTARQDEPILGPPVPGSGPAATTPVAPGERPAAAPEAPRPEPLPPLRGLSVAEMWAMLGTAPPETGDAGTASAQTAVTASPSGQAVVADLGPQRRADVRPLPSELAARVYAQAEPPAVQSVSASALDHPA